MRQKVDLFRYQTDFTTTLYTSTESVGPAAVRPDGSGVLLTQSNLQQPVVVDIATRQATDVAAFTGGVRVLSRGVLLR